MHFYKKITRVTASLRKRRKTILLYSACGPLNFNQPFAPSYIAGGRNLRLPYLGNNVEPAFGKCAVGEFAAEIVLFLLKRIEIFHEFLVAGEKARELDRTKARDTNTPTDRQKGRRTLPAENRGG